MSVETIYIILVILFVVGCGSIRISPYLSCGCALAITLILLFNVNLLFGQNNYCKVCGSELRVIEAGTCSECVVQCKDCVITYDKTVNFCSQCGKNLTYEGQNNE